MCERTVEETYSAQLYFEGTLGRMAPEMETIIECLSSSGSGTGSTQPL
jgi:hypothetical protein